MLLQMYMPPRVVPSGLLLIMLLAPLGASCRTGGAGTAGSPGIIVQPGAPGQSTRTVSAEQAADLSRVQPTAADVTFMQGMIGHHQQAIEMVELLTTRTASEGMRKLGERISVSQADEIGMMRTWLRAHGQAVPDEHAMHVHGATLMPGMLTEEEMDRLAVAKGARFDRLFLEGMIKHHGGALTMVKDLLATPGAAQDSEIFGFIADVDADQRMEIDRMSDMLRELPK